MKRSVSFGIAIFFVLSCCVIPRLDAGQDILLQDMEPEISLDFKNAGLTDVLKAFSIQSGLNFIAAGRVRDRKITLYLDKVPLEKAMVKLFKANNLAYELDRDSNIFIVKDLGMPEVELITRVFHLRYATVSTSSVKEELKDKLVGQSATLSDEDDSSSGGSEDESGKWLAEETAGITEAVKQLLSMDRVTGKPLGFVIEDFRTNSLIVSDTPAKMEVIASLIHSLDRPIAQVMLEVEMLDVSKDLVDQLGFNWADAGSFSMQVLSASQSTLFPLASAAGTFSSSGATPGTLQFSGTPGSGLSSLKLVLDFLRTQTDTKDLARPRVLTLDNETAEIKIQTNEVIGVDITFDDNGLIQDKTAERDNTGVSLRVTPQINKDTGEITMFIVPVVREAFDSTFLDAENNKFKNIEERSTKSIVKVRDGDTIILGGLIRTEFANTETKLPLLGDIPWLGSLFRHKNTTKNLERELLVFITPHIIDQQGTNIVSEARNFTLPQREQSTLTGVNRNIIIDSSLNSFDKAQ
ncbi:MAG: hypothetical protein MJA29_09140 [Candidatus Omnitrophica bacterium]|nr:hypothetical protein [Candidatus Omnitrophota bacterium]